ncbi:MAG: hypothetical protein GF313_05140 [Caldithrix sp.]|nr:hypothetical protein [Caldithrix sp.]
MNKILGFRQYLNSQHSFSDLNKIIKERDAYLPSDDGFLTIIALCGKNPRDFLERNNLLDRVAFYDFAPWEESARRVAEVYTKSQYKPDRVQLIHYHEQPLGLTYPLELLVQISNILKMDHLAVSDSDFQLNYSTIRKVFDFHVSVAQSDERVITYPRREFRSLDLKKYPINRRAMEDLENVYIYMLSDLKILDSKPDFQSGLSVTTRAANQILNFTNVGSWIGNLHMAIQVIRSNGRLEKDFVVPTNQQHESSINFDIQCAKIDQLYRYYMIPFSNIVHLALDHPDRYLMEDWTKGLTDSQIAQTIYQIEEMNNQYLQKRRKEKDQEADDSHSLSNG